MRLFLKPPLALYFFHPAVLGKLRELLFGAMSGQMEILPKADVQIFKGIVVLPKQRQNSNLMSAVEIRNYTNIRSELMDTCQIYADVGYSTAVHVGNYKVGRHENRYSSP